MICIYPELVVWLATAVFLFGWFVGNWSRTEEVKLVAEKPADVLQYEDELAIEVTSYGDGSTKYRVFDGESFWFSSHEKLEDAVAHLNKIREARKSQRIVSSRKLYIR